MNTGEALQVSGHVLPDDKPTTFYIVDGLLSMTPVPRAHRVVDSGWIVPGLVDAHCHLGIAPGVGAVSDPAVVGRQAQIQRDAGVLALRDLGSPIPYSRFSRDQQLPQVIRAGRHIARPKRYKRGYAAEIAPDHLAVTMLEQAAVADGWVKLVGDWIDRDQGQLLPLWEKDHLVEAVKAVHKHGSRVAVHTFSPLSVDDLLAAGVDSLEHGTGVGSRHMDFMAEHQIALVPTAIVTGTFAAIAARAGKYAHYAQTMLDLSANAPRITREAAEAGVPIYIGTDGGGLAFGQIAKEIQLLHSWGLNLADMIAAASWKARSWLGLPAGIAEGEPVDCVVYDADPRKEIGTLAKPKRIILRGEVIC